MNETVSNRTVSFLMFSRAFCDNNECNDLVIWKVFFSERTLNASPHQVDKLTLAAAANVVFLARLDAGNAETRVVSIKQKVQNHEIDISTHIHISVR